MKIEELTPVDSTLEELGRRLAACRKQQSLSQTALANSAGLGVATLRRMEGGNDSQLGSWIKTLQALGLADALDAMLPEQLRSPMAEAKAARKQRGARSRRASAPPHSSADSTPWGDEAP